MYQIKVVSILLLADTRRSKNIGKYRRISPWCVLPASANSTLDPSEALSFTTAFSTYHCNLSSLCLFHLCLNSSICLQQHHVAISYIIWKSSSWLPDTFPPSWSSSRANTEWLLPTHLFQTLQYLFYISLSCSLMTSLFQIGTSYLM